MKTLYRIMGIFALVSILLAFFAIPASAASTFTPDSIVDFMDVGTVFTKKTDKGFWNTDAYQEPSYNTGITWLSLGWTNQRTFSGTVYITIRCVVRPATLTLQSYAGGPLRDCVYTGSNGEYHSYYVKLSASFVNITLKATWSSAYTGVFNLTSCVGYSDPCAAISDFDYKVYEDRWHSNGVNNVTDLGSGSASTPYSIASHSADTSVYSIHSGIFEVIFDPSITGYSVGSSLSVLLRHTGGLSDVGLSILKNDSVISVIDALPFESIVSSSRFSFGLGTFVESYYSLVTFELDGYDFTGCDFLVSGKVDSVPAGISGSFAHYGWSLIVTGISLEPFIHEMEWYDVFYYKLNSTFNHWSQQDKSFYNSTSSSLSSLNTKLSDISSKLNADSNLKTDSQNFGSVVTQQKNDFNSANDSLNSVSKPDISLIQTDSSVIINPSGFNVLSVPLKNIFQHNLILSILVIVATCALIGYVFFGKR